MILVYVTHETKEEAEKLVKHLLAEKLIACANFHGIESMYRWEDEIESGVEVVTLLKSKEELWTKLRDEIERIHPYETPCIIRIDCEAAKGYEDWVWDETC